MCTLRVNSRAGFCNKPVLNVHFSLVLSWGEKLFQDLITSIAQTLPSDIDKIEHLRGELEMLRKAVEASGEVIFMTDREGTITYINPEFTKLYGYQPVDVVGKTTPRILKSGLLTPHDYQQFWDVLIHKQVVHREFINKCKDGSLVTVDGSANPILDGQENIIGFLAIQRDITKRKQAKEALETAFAHQQSILDGIADPIMVISTNYHVKSMNHAAQILAPNGIEAAQLVFCYQVSHRCDAPCDGLDHPCPLTQVQKSRKTVIVEHKHYLTSGELRIVEVIASPLWDIDGSFQGIIESMRDITEHVQTEEKLQQYAEQLRALAAQSAEVAEMERQRLAQELHDQVGQNLTALGINLNIIQSQLPSETMKAIDFHLSDSVQLVEQTTERIRNVLADLRPPALDDYGLLAALRWYSNLFSKRTDIAVTVVGEEPTPRFAMRVENTLFRIAQEAMTNVAKHAQATQINVKVDWNHESLHLVIKDNGIGFDPLVSTGVNDGTGWGLLNITERAEALGGQCSVVSAPGKGTLVIVDVPL